MKASMAFRKITACVCALISRCQQILRRVARRPRPTALADRATPQQAREGTMLVESDVKKGIRGILP